jgi:hypothetical protein
MPDTYESSSAAKIWNMAGHYGLWMTRNNPNSHHTHVMETYLDPAAVYWKGNAVFGFFLCVGALYFVVMLLAAISGFFSGEPYEGPGFVGWLVSCGAFYVYIQGMLTFYKFTKWKHIAAWNSPFLVAALIGSIFYIVHVQNTV